MNSGQKIFLCDFSSPEYVAIAREFKRRGAHILYWTGFKEFFDAEAAKSASWGGTVFHSSREAILGRPADAYRNANFPPPDAALLRELLECESVTLSMMNRADFGNLPLAKKKSRYYSYVSYWDGVLAALRPDAIVLGEIPHTMYNFVLYALAKRRGIKTVMPATTSIWGFLSLVTDYKKNDEHLRDEYARIRAERHTPDELHPALRRYFVSEDRSADLTPAFNVERAGRTRSRLAKLMEYRQPAEFWRRAVWHLRSLFFLKKKPLALDEGEETKRVSLWELRRLRRIKKALRDEYMSCARPVDLSRPFVYFPLHFQPERSTSPMADHYTDQILIAKTVAATLPEGWSLLIKEYPLQWDPYSYRAHLARYEGYYRELAAIPGVTLVPMTESPFKLMESAQAVVTATGTSGIEALTIGKPVLIFGYPWYMYCDGVYRIDSPASCRAALEAIQSGAKPDVARVLNYFVAFQRTAIRTAQRLRFQPVHDITPEQSVKNISDALWGAIV